MADQYLTVILEPVMIIPQRDAIGKDFDTGFHWGSIHKASMGRDFGYNGGFYNFSVNPGKYIFIASQYHGYHNPEIFYLDLTSNPQEALNMDIQLERELDLARIKGQVLQKGTTNFVPVAKIKMLFGDRQGGVWIDEEQAFEVFG